MIIYDYLKCENCKEQYVGAFKINNSGLISCIDCDNKIVISEHKIDKNNSELEQKMVFYHLEEDIQRLYPIRVGLDDLKIDMFLKEDSTLDEYKLYYQGNSLDFCKNIRDYAYICLNYLETNDEKYIQFSKDFIDNYLDLRFRKLSTQEVSEFEKLILSSEMTEILIRLGD